MVDSKSHEAGGSSSSRRDKEETRSSDRDRHKHHHSSSSSSRRHRDDKDNRRHSSRSDSKRDDKERHRSSRDDDRHRHRHSSHHSRSSHHHHSSSEPRRDRETEEERADRKRRHREDDAENRERHKDESWRHDSRSHHHHGRRHHEDPESSSRRSRSERDSHHRDNEEKQPACDFIPTSESLSLTSNPTASETHPSITPTTSTLKRDDWMTGAPTNDEDTSSSYFSSFGKARIKPPRPEKPDPEKLKISSRELNTQLVEGKSVDEYSAPESTKSTFGAPGYQWRMMKLKRTLEAAESEGRKVEEVALERYASLEDFQQACGEKEFLDGKDGKQKDSGTARNTPTLRSVARRSYLLASGGAGAVAAETSEKSRGSDSDSAYTSRPGSRQGFKRPGESSNPTTPQPTTRPPRNVGFERTSSTSSTPLASAIPSVFTPVFERPESIASTTEGGAQAGLVLDDGHSDPDRPIFTSDQLNKLQARILRAELMGDPNLASLKAEYEAESTRAAAHKVIAGDRGGAFASSSSAAKSQKGNVGVLVGDGSRELQVLPTLDARGRLYDVGSSNPTTSNTSTQSKRKLKGRDDFEARDPKTGQIIRYSANDDQVSLSDLVRQEKFSAGFQWEKNPDAELAANIVSDIGYSQDLDEQDEEAHRYAKKKMRSDALKRQFAIGDFAKTRAALDRCRHCWQDEGSRPPTATVVSSGYRAYLAIPDTESATGVGEDHMVVVPMQHVLSLLEADDEVWEELRNFQKCLVQMADTLGKRVVFYEMLLNLKHQAHAVMEAVFVPKAAMDLLPGVFKQSLREQGGEWSTHKKVIAFQPDKPFRNSLVPNLPYFAVCFDYKWTTGFGHVIENMERDGKSKEDEDAFDVEEMAAGHGGGGSGGRFDVNFARDIIRGVLEDLENENNDGEGEGAVGGGMGYVRGFGKSRRSEEDKRRVKEKFKKDWDAFDWTKQLQT